MINENIGSNTVAADYKADGVATINLNGAVVITLSDNGAGLALPNVTTAERDAIVGPVAGQLVLNTTTSKVNAYDGSGWVAITSA